LVGVSGGGGDLDPVGPSESTGLQLARGDEGDLPAGHFAGEVASGAGAAAVGQGGRAAVAPAVDVVEAADGASQ